MKIKRPRLYLLHNRLLGLYSDGHIPPTYVPLRRAKIWRAETDFIKHLRLLVRWLREQKGFDLDMAFAQLMLPELDIHQYDLYAPSVVTPLSKYPLPANISPTGFLIEHERKLI